MLEQHLAAAITAHRAADERHASELTKAAARLAELKSQHDAALAQAASAREALEGKLAEALATQQQIERRAAAEREAAAQHAAQRQAELEGRLEQAEMTRATLEQQLTAAITAHGEADERHASELSRAAADLAQRQAQHDAALAQEAAAQQTVQQAFDAAYERVQTLTKALGQERESREQFRLASEAELERISRERAAERGALEARVGERDALLQERAASHAAAQQAARNTLAQIEERLRQAMEASGREIAQLRTELASLTRELEETRSDRDAQRTEAVRVPQLLNELDESQRENRRQFQQAPVAIWRCRRDGALTHVNRALVSLLGYRTSDDLMKVDLAAAVFESPDDLGWLIERCVSMGTTESVDAIFRRKDRGRLVVRLLARAVSPEVIEIVAEDITTLRTLEGRLRQTERMEAVGRLASEVAATCDNLLRDVSQNGQQWLAAIGDNAALRHRGELLLGDVTRAATLLRQLMVYGKTQTSALEPVNVSRVLRHLAPVLKHVAGNDIEFVLPKALPAADVDVDAERVERVLVNVASYARERMPSGGRLNIDLATVTVDRQFVAKYPNVRPGAHVLITVTEERGTARPDAPIGLRTEPGAGSSTTPPSDKPGVDLGALLSLIGDCGGHLWMAAEPPGNMVLKIHLPRRTQDGPSEPRTPAPRSERGRAMARWFGH
jgi:PAS domain S-box-containing protein